MGIRDRALQIHRLRASAQDLPIEDTKELSAREDQVEFESCLDLQKLMEALPQNMRAATGLLSSMA